MSVSACDAGVGVAARASLFTCTGLASGAAAEAVNGATAGANAPGGGASGLGMEPAVAEAGA